MSQLTEAEISGNDDLVRELLAKLSDRKSFPAKAFCFHTDARPGYFGTWTRSSRIIGPRTPFAKDTLIFDYAYDSGEEWEDEPAGEDVVDDAEEEDADGDEQDSDLDSWLVDDDDEPDLEELGRSSPPPLFDGPHALLPKRKADDSDNKIGKKRKVVIPLVPFVKGPVYETTVGQCQYEPFKPYAIRLMNGNYLELFFFLINADLSLAYFQILHFLSTLSRLFPLVLKTTRRGTRSKLRILPTRKIRLHLPSQPFLHG